MSLRSQCTSRGMEMAANGNERAWTKVGSSPGGVRLALATLCLVGCAHASSPAPRPTTTKAPETGELDKLRHAMADRDRKMRALENRMALLEAENREMRRIAEASGGGGGREGPIRSTVHIGKAHREARNRRPDGQPRPMLQLSGGMKKAPSKPLLPVPQVSERLSIAPLPTRPVESMSRAPQQPGNEYRAALDLVRRRDFDRALSALSAFLVRYPTDTRIAAVLFWRGEVQFALEDYKGALASFDGALRTAPSGVRAADALLKMGLCHRRLGAPTQARTALERLKTQFPDSDAARLASREDA